MPCYRFFFFFRSVAESRIKNLSWPVNVSIRTQKRALKSIKSSSFANSKVYSTSYQADSFPIEERKK